MVDAILRLWGESKQKKSLIGLVVLYCILGVLSIIRSSMIGFITQGAIGLDSQTIRNSVVILIGVAVFELGGLWLGLVHKSRIIQTIRAHYKDKTAKSILDSQFHVSQALEKGDIIGRLNSDTSSLATAFDLVISVARSVLTLIILTIGIAFFDIRIMLAFLISIPFYFISQAIISVKSAPNIMPWKIARGESHALTQELLSNRTTIKTFSLKPIAMQWFQNALEKNYRTGVKGIGRLYQMNLVQFLFVFAPIFIVSMTGAWLVVNDNLSITALVSTILLSQISLSFLAEIQNSTQNIPHLLTSTQRIFPLWDTPEEASSDLCGSDEISIEFEHVSFAYPSAPNQLILHDVSFRIQHGDHIGLVGPSGCGKSTILKLISGLYEPTSGTIRINGLDMQRWNKHALRETISVVSQNTYLFEDSIINNLRLAKPSVTYEEAESVLKSLNLDAFLKSVPSGLESNIGEKGSKLSGGQRQRLSIARSILKNAPLMLFDEATSALDAQSEKEIEPLLFKGDKTVIAIAHRFATIKDMDRILVFDQGRCVASGNHQELMQNSILYKELYEKQGDNDETV